MKTIEIKAKNSSGEQTLYIDKYIDDENEEIYSFTLVGNYEGQDIQIDFDELTPDEFRDFIAKLYKLTRTKI